MGKKEGNEKCFWDMTVNQRRWRGLEQWVVFSGLISATEMLSQPGKELGWDGHSLERILQLQSLPTAAGLFPDLSPCFPEDAPGAGSTVAMLQNSWDAEDQFFLVGSSWGRTLRAAELWMESLMLGSRSCRDVNIIFLHHFSTFINMNAAPLQTCMALINEILIFLRCTNGEHKQTGAAALGLTQGLAEFFWAGFGGA